MKKKYNIEFFCTQQSKSKLTALYFRKSKVTVNTLYSSKEQVKTYF